MKYDVIGFYCLSCSSGTFGAMSCESQLTYTDPLNSLFKYIDKKKCLKFLKNIDGNLL